MFDEVLAFHDRFTVWVGAGVPVPVRASAEVVGCALLVNVSEAAAAPAVCGLKVTVNGALWPAGIVNGSERPPTLNTELFVLAPVSVTLAPLAARLPEAVPLVPATTLPRANVAGFTLNCPTAVVPVPETGMVNVGFEASELRVTFPLVLPADCGANDTLKPTLWPAPNVTGVVMPPRLNPVPLIPTWEIVTLRLPVLVTVSAMVCVLPTVTVPKASLA